MNRIELAANTHSKEVSELHSSADRIVACGYFVAAGAAAAGAAVGAGIAAAFHYLAHLGYQPQNEVASPVPGAPMTGMSVNQLLRTQQEALAA